MQTVIDPPSTRGLTRNQWAQLAGALVICVSLLIAIIAVAFLGLWVGGAVGNWVRQLTNAADQSPIELKWAGWLLLPPSIQRGFLPQAVGVASAGVGAKLFLDSLPLFPVLILPLVTFSRLGIPNTPLPFGEAIKSALFSLFDNWRVISTVLGVTFSLSAAAWAFEPKETPISTTFNNVSVVVDGHTFVLNVPPSSGPSSVTPTPADAQPSLGSSESVASRAFVVFFEEEDATVTSSGAFKAGLSFSQDEFTKGALARFAERLAYCNRDGRSAAVRIKGFASSSPFKLLTLSESDKLNKALANERARTVADILSRHDTARTDGSAHLTKTVFVPHVWQTFDEMRDERAYEDRVANEYSLGRGQLNRRAEIVIEDAAACTRR